MRSLYLTVIVARGAPASASRPWNLGTRNIATNETGGGISLDIY